MDEVSIKDVKEPTVDVTDLIIALLKQSNDFDMDSVEAGAHTGSALYIYESESAKGSYEMKGTVDPKAKSMQLTANGEVSINGNKIKFADTVFEFTYEGSINVISGDIYLDGMKVKFEDIEKIFGAAKQTSMVCIDSVAFCDGTLSTVEYDDYVTHERSYKLILDVKKEGKSVQLCFSNVDDDALYYEYFQWVKESTYCSKLEYVCVDGVFYNPETISDAYPLS